MALRALLLLLACLAGVRGAWWGELEDGPVEGIPASRAKLEKRPLRHGGSIALFDTRKPNLVVAVVGEGWTPAA